MTGRLSEEQMNQLESWIGTGPKKFTLLYSITRDGCVASTFHNKCDDQGPTVTVLYSPQDSVYGGYTVVSWKITGRGIYKKDQYAFLFQLQFSGAKKCNKFTCKNSENAIYVETGFGPIFGSGHDLQTFHNTVKVSNGIYALRGGLSAFGNTYNSLGMTAGDVNNGTMNVTELEVYHVTDGQRISHNPPTQKPWRKAPELSGKYLDQLKEDLEGIKPNTESGLSEFRILMLGPVGSGKSSFYNTVDSIFRGRISHRAACGSGDHSTTTVYTPYQLRTRNGAKLAFRLCDTNSLDANTGPDTNELCYLTDGHVPDNYQFNPNAPLTLRSPELVLKPQPANLIHCVTFVCDASKLESISAEVLTQMKRLRKHLDHQKMPHAIILTKFDNVDTDLADKPGDVFLSTKINEVVVKAASTFGVPPNTIFPVKNYHSEVHLDDQVSALALLALQQLLYLAEDYVENELMNIVQDGATGGAHGRNNAPDDQTETNGSDTA